jgi:hypothetical protein
MSLEMFQAILDKAQLETIVRGICLFNWAEPLLHPRCPEFVAECHKRGLACHLSTNLNSTRNLKETLHAKPTSIRISLSGWTNDSSNKTHTGGNLDKVKERILEFLSVLKLKGEMKGPILCFVGPPGVGKSQIIAGIANAPGVVITGLMYGVLDKFVEAYLSTAARDAPMAAPSRSQGGLSHARLLEGEGARLDEQPGAQTQAGFHAAFTPVSDCAGVFWLEPR